MPKKTGLSLFKKEKLKREVMKANCIQIQLQALEKLAKKPMNSKELKDFIENSGGDYYVLLPILKNSGLLEVKRAEAGKQGSDFVYSLRSM